MIRPFSLILYIHFESDPLVRSFTQSAHIKDQALLDTVGTLVNKTKSPCPHGSAVAVTHYALVIVALFLLLGQQARW